MELTVAARTVSHVMIIDLSGRFSFTDDSLRELVNSSLQQGRRNFLLNLAAVSHLGTLGINQMISLWKSIRNKGGVMGIVSLTDRVREVLIIPKLDTVFPIYKDETEAIKHFPNASR